MTWIGFSAHDFFLWFHIMLFVFWLGADLGVFYTAKYVADPELSKPERLRFLQLLLKVDMFPRSSLILMLPVGFTLSLLSGWGMVSGTVLLAIWAAAIAWFVLMWMVHKKPQAAGLKKLDLAVRWGVLVGLVGLGVASLISDVFTDQAWLAIKLILFAVVIGLGLLLRGSVALWVKGFGLLESDPDAGNALITGGRSQATRFAHTLWLCLTVMALLGVSKAIA